MTDKGHDAESIQRYAFALDAACQAYWESINIDGWSWRELRDGQAGNTKRERELRQSHAEDIAVAIECAINAFTHHNAPHPRPAPMAEWREIDE